jgi:inosine-uridine nucleoside N-ribohydrolase
LPQKLVIDADPGIGDALAITLALLDPEVDVVGITPTAGCVSGEQASRNLYALVGLLDPPKWPRMAWAHSPAAIIESQGGPNWQILNGPSGLGDLASPVAEPHQRHEPAKQLIDLIRSHPHELTLLTLGPLTNVELAQERCPELLSLLKGLVILGGSVTASGNVTAAAEFNMYADPEAARTIVNSPSTKTLVPLEVTNRVTLSFSQFDRLSMDSHTRLERILHGLIPFALRAHHEHLGMELLPIPEVVALVSIVRPELFERQSLPVDVETRGPLTRGMTVCDRRRASRSQANLDVLHGVDPQGVVDYLNLVVRNAMNVS